MSTKKSVMTGALAALAVLAFAAKKQADPVLLTVDKKPVTAAEFMYLYNKNNKQQTNPQTIAEYLPMFVDYKLKVAEAESQGLDTTATFLDEYNKFFVELAEPYMRDTTVMGALLEEAYAHQLADVKVKHIMLPLPTTPEEQKASLAKADSLRNLLLEGKADWDSVAAKNSIDRGSSQRGGMMGWLPLGVTPWSFEKAAYDTPVGQISQPVNSGFGYHLVMPVDRRPSRGEVLVQHILKLTVRKSPLEAEQAKAQIDSIYQVLAAGADFDEVASRESEDGSRLKGGRLDWFGTGKMVAEFDSVAFALEDGQLSQPVKTQYGYHIVKRLDHRDVPSFEQSKERLTAAIEGDERSQQPVKVFVDAIVKDFNGKVFQSGLDAVRALVVANGGYDSVAVQNLTVSNIPVYEIDGRQYPVSSVMHMVPVTAATDADNAVLLVNSAAESGMRQKAYDLQRQRLMQTNADFRNLINEYRDGILLFDVANANVWDKAAKDTEGLEEFFNANRDKYRWQAPKYKGFIIFATNDSVADVARKYADTLVGAMPESQYAAALRAKFGRDIKVERVLAAKGDNPISDYLVFDGPRPADDTLRWKSFFAFGGHIAGQPENAADVRGQVTTDYQNALEKQWVADLRARHKVKINKKVLESLK